VDTKVKTRRSEQKEATREQILEAAKMLLAEHGYAALRVAAVAAKAEISLGGLLHHFPTKDALVIAVLERLSAHVLRLAIREASRASSDEDVFGPISKSAERFYAAPEFLMYLDIFLSGRRHTEIGDTAIRLLPSQRAAMEELWKPHLTERGISEEHAVLIIRSLWALSRGLALSSSTEHDKPDNQETINFVLNALRQTYGKK